MPGVYVSAPLARREPRCSHLVALIDDYRSQHVSATGRHRRADLFNRLLTDLKESEAS
jgi:hypothetical protein